MGGTQRLPRRIGIQRAKELIFTGDLIDAAEAQRFGIVNHVFPTREEMMSFVETLVEKISSKSPVILRLAKEALNRSATGLKDGLDYESVLFELCFSTSDQKRGSESISGKPQKTGIYGLLILIRRTYSLFLKSHFELKGVPAFSVIIR